MSLKTAARRCLSAVRPYLPGKPIAEVQRELGLKRVVKLASNENFLGPSPKAINAAKRAVKDTWLYPEGSSPLLRRALAARYGIGEGQVILGNGSDEIIRLACEAFLEPGDEALCSEQGFIRFKQQSMLMGARVIEVPMREMRHDLKAMARAITPKTKLVFVASPNNPTGTYNTREELSGLLESLPESAILILDEAYYHYARRLDDYPESLSEFLPKHPNLLVLRTFSKAYGLAGFRVGLGVAQEELISWLDRIRMPFNVNSVAQAAAREALSDVAFMERGVRQTTKNREGMRAELEKLGLKVTPSAANFLCVEAPLPGKELFGMLLHQGVIVRPLDEYGLTSHVRISIGSVVENKVLLSALKKIVSSERSAAL